MTTAHGTQHGRRPRVEGSGTVAPPLAEATRTKPGPVLCDCGHAPVSHAPVPPDWTEQTGACMWRSHCGCHGWAAPDADLSEARASRVNCAAVVAGCAMFAAVVLVLAWAAALVLPLVWP